jgi:hypothetical protein
MLSAITLSIVSNHLPTPFLPFIPKMAPNRGNKNIEIIDILSNEPKERHLSSKKTK